MDVPSFHITIMEKEEEAGEISQDCLALLIMDPSNVRQMIVDNYGGVRIDGTNATIIGNKQGEFIADRNNITRVRMDHAFAICNDSSVSGSDRRYGCSV